MAGFFFIASYRGELANALAISPSSLRSACAGREDEIERVGRIEEEGARYRRVTGRMEAVAARREVERRTSILRFG